MTSLPALGEAGVAIVFATLFAQPTASWSRNDTDRGVARVPPTYETPREAAAIALEMLEVYEEWAGAGHVRLILDRASLEEHLTTFPTDRVPGFLVTLEGADPIVAVDDLPFWFARGLRMISLAWGSTRYAGGTGSTAGLTGAGRELLAAMAELGIAHDASHLSEEAFWEALECPHHALCVTHANVRALMTPPPGRPAKLPLNRHLSDRQIAEIARPHGAGSSGVIGLVLLNCFLDPNWWIDPEGRKQVVSLRSQAANHLNHVAAIAGWESVGIGSDVDSGFGRDETPLELDSIVDWAKLGEHIPQQFREGVLGGNWIRFLREVLPA